MTNHLPKVDVVLVGFPGTRYDYRDFVGHNGARIDLPPVSLMGRPGWNSSE